MISGLDKNYDGISYSSNFSKTSNENGRFKFDLLTEGNYNLSFSKEKEELEEFEFSETMARFRLISLMEDYNMKGMADGYTIKGRPRFGKIKTGIIRREKQEDFEPVWNPGLKVEGPEVQEETLLGALRCGAERYNRIIRHL